MTAHRQPLERCLSWIERHPKSMLWLLFVSTANFVLAIIQAVHAL